MNTMVVERSPADIYDEKFVPALFFQWGPIICAAAEVSPGQNVLDIACGTGAATITASRLAGPSGKVTGLDANPQMLSVARRKSATIDWREGSAESLPFSDNAFDSVISQFGMMFFEDRPGSVREMMRVLKPGGRFAVAVCGALDRSPGYASFAALLDDLFGKDVGNAFRAPFVLGDKEALAGIAKAAGIEEYSIKEEFGAVQFRSIADLVSTERACVWTLGGILDQSQFDLLLNESETALNAFVNDSGNVRFDMPALILTARKQT